MRKAIQGEIISLKDERYKEFSLKLLPGVPEDSLMGVRIPLLRKKASEIAKGSYWSDFLKENDNLFFEEKMLQAMVIALVKIEARDRIILIEQFLPKIDNWSLCDIFCSSLKFAREEINQELIWQFIKPLFHDKREYYVRFASVMSLNYYLNPKYFDKVLNLYNEVNHEGYYAKMAVAWGISLAFVKDKEKTKELLEKNSLDKFTYNKALQKIRDSFQVSLEEKQLLKKLK